MAEKEEESVEEVEVDPIPDPGGIMERVPKGWDHPDGSKKQKLVRFQLFEVLERPDVVLDRRC